MRKILYILVVLLLLPACGEKSGSATVTTDTQKPVGEVAQDEGAKYEEKKAETAKALMGAAEKLDLGKVKELIRDGADVNANGSQGMTVLHVAARLSW